MQPELVSVVDEFRALGEASRQLPPVFRGLYEQFVAAGFIHDETGELTEERIAEARARIVRLVSSPPRRRPARTGPDCHHFDASHADSEAAIEEWERFKAEIRSGRR